MADENVITKEMMTVYITVIEKHVQQMTVVVSHLEQLNDKFEEVEGKLAKIEEHFHNGFKSDIIEHGSGLAGEVKSKVDELSKAVSEQKNSVKEQITALTTNYEMKTSDLKASLKIDRAINIVGWAALIATILVKIFGKG